MLERSGTLSTERTDTVPPLSNFARAQKLEADLLDAAVQRGSGTIWSVWRTHQALIAPRLATHADRFPVAARAMSGRGWPVYVRDTGGDITPQSPGIVNVSSAFVLERNGELSIRTTYEQFCHPLLAFLESLGIKAHLASVPGSFCDGEFNIAIDGKKLAGTAQRWRLVRTSNGKPGVAVLAHAAILADADIAVGVAETNRFYRLCGFDRTVDPTLHVSTADLSGLHLAAAPLATRIASFLTHWR